MGSVPVFAKAYSLYTLISSGLNRLILAAREAIQNKGFSSCLVFGFKPTIEMLLLWNWKCFSNSARSRWLLRGHMIPNNKTVSRPNL